MRELTSLLLALCVGCGGTGASGTASTCYDTVIASAQSCLPPPGATGVLDDAGTLCVFEGGDQVTFALPEVAGISNFVLASGAGNLCMSYQSNLDGGHTLETPGGTAVSTSTGNVACPDGTAYRGTTPVGSISAYGGGLATFTLVTADGGESVFNCSSN
jgi:hypothetical protein